MDAIYDRIGTNYTVERCTDPKIARQLHAYLQGATSLVNIGAGTGSYEPKDAALVAIEPSIRMIAQRKSDAHPVLQAYAEKLPLEDKSFSHAMTILSMHHWEDLSCAFQEISRVVRDKFVAISWDPESEPFWLTKDYFPEIYDMDQSIFPKKEVFEQYFDQVEFAPLQVPYDCQDGFMAAFWRRPEAYLSSKVRQSISSFSKIKEVSKGLKKLENDLSSGAWTEKNREIMTSESLDLGYRIISAKIRK